MSRKYLRQRTSSATWQRDDKWKSFELLFILSWKDTSVWSEVVTMHEMTEMAETIARENVSKNLHILMFFLSSRQGQVRCNFDSTHDL